jgi:geranylgeranyl reductase family protein
MTDAVKKTYNIVIIGAGPAGLNAARTISSASPSASVLLVDSVKPWEEPIACAEGVFKNEFHRAIEPRPEWIRFLVDKAIYHSPDNKTIRYVDKNKGYIIDRARMQKDMAEDCSKNGISFLYGVRVNAVTLPDSENRRSLLINGKNSINASVVIDCSGPLSTIGKEEKIISRPPDLEVACLAHVLFPSVDTTALHLHAGSLIAPGAYAWAFPRDDKSLNIGVIIGSAFRKGARLRELLDSFISSYYAGGKIERVFAGTIPCTSGHQPLAVSGLIKAGDSASMVNPVTRAGITEALIAGELAGKCALEMLGAESSSKMRMACRKYEKAWQEKRGRRHEKLAKVKKSLAKVPDSDYNESARRLGSIPQDKLTMSKIFAVSLARFPRLVWALRHML